MSMNYNDMMQRINECPDLAGIGPALAENLFWRAENQRLGEGEVIYRRGAGLDNTFAVLLSGELAVERAGETVGTVNEHQVFGEMAYFSQFRSRNATIRVSSNGAAILKFRVSPVELGSQGLYPLRRRLVSLAIGRSPSPSPTLIA